MTITGDTISYAALMQWVRSHRAAIEAEAREETSDGEQAAYGVVLEIEIPIAETDG